MVDRTSQTAHPRKKFKFYSENRFRTFVEDTNDSDQPYPKITIHLPLFKDGNNIIV